MLYAGCNSSPASAAVHRGPVLGKGTANFIIKPYLLFSESSGSLMYLQVYHNILFVEAHFS